MFSLLIFIESRFMTLFSLSKWNFSVFSVRNYLIVLSFYLFLIILLSLLNKNKKKISILAASLLFSFFLYGRLSWALFVLAAIFYTLTFIKGNKFLKIILLFLLSQVFIVMAINILSGYSYLFWLAYLFANLFFIRFVLYFYHSLRNNFKRGPVLDYYLYLFCPVYFIIFPSVIILPQYEYFVSSFARENEFISVSKSGLKFFFIGLLELILLAFVGILLTSHPKLHAGINKNLVANMFYCFFVFLLIVTAYGNLLFGLVRGIGYNIRPPFRNPFFSRDIVDFFDRTLNYFKEYIITIFFVPLSILMRKFNSYIAVFFSAVFAVFLGGTLHSLLSLGLQFCALVNNNITGPSNVIAAYIDQLNNELSIYGFYSAILLIAKNAFLLGLLLASQLCFNQMNKAAAYKKKKTFAYFLTGAFQFFIMLAVVYVMTGPHDSLE